MGGSCGLGEAVRAGWWVRVRPSPRAAKKQRCFCSCTVPSCGFLPLACIFNVQFCNSAKGEGFCRACAEQSPAECLCHHVPPVGLCSPVWLHGPPVRGVALVPLAPVALGRALTCCHQGSARSEACCYTHPERCAPKPVSFPLVDLGAGVPEVPPRLLTSSLSLQRWSRTSCAVSARCCESWTATTPPASMTEVRSWGQHRCHPACALHCVTPAPLCSSLR